jgi:hypothetical protein
MAVYLLHIEPSYKHAAHYLGHAEDTGPRFNAHYHGRGARLTQVAVEAGCELILARVWPDGDRKLERRLKRRHSGVRLCPICRGEPVQLPLLWWMPTTRPQVVVECNTCGWDKPPEGECPICTMTTEFPF